MPDTIHVAVAVIVNSKAEVCISLRHKTSHQGGLWEFPGGKIESQETAEQALNREIKEELDLDILSSRPLITVSHNYPDKKVKLHVRRVLSYNGVATGIEGQQVRWVPVRQLSSYKFPAANQAIIKAVQLPDKYLITGKFSDKKDFLIKLKRALENDIELVQLRLKKSDLNLDKEQVVSLIQQASALCEVANVKLLLNIPEAYRQLIERTDIVFDGFHADSRTLQLLSQRPASRLFSASCHNVDELKKATRLGADFVVLSPVKKTGSHPEMDAMDWPPFSVMVDNCSIPVYALGGVSAEDIADAWQHGAQGVAAISAFWY